MRSIFSSDLQSIENYINDANIYNIETNYYVEPSKPNNYIIGNKNIQTKTFYCTSMFSVEPLEDGYLTGYQTYSLYNLNIIDNTGYVSAKIITPGSTTKRCRIYFKREDGVQITEEEVNSKYDIKILYPKSSYAKQIIDNNISTISDINITPRWSIGSLSAGGYINNSDTTNIRSTWIDGTNTQYLIYTDPGYRYSIYYYHKNSTAAVDKSFSHKNTDLNNVKLTDIGYWIAILVRKNDSSDIDISASQHVKIVAVQSNVGTNWNGLYVSMLGDSISSCTGSIPSENKAYYTGSNSGVSHVNQMWWYNLISKMGGTPLVMDAWSGSTVTRGVRTPTSSNSYVSMCEDSRCRNIHAYVKDNEIGSIDVTNANIGSMRIAPFINSESLAIGDKVYRIDPDIILMTGGGNDYSYDAPMGTWNGHSTLNSEDLTTFREAYANTLNKIRQEYPMALVICVKPWFFIRPNLPKDQVNINSINLTYKDYIDAIEEIADLMACPVIDGFTNGFNRYNYYNNFAVDYETTTTHPNIIGQTIIGNNLLAQCKNLCPGYVNYIKALKKTN